MVILADKIQYHFKLLLSNFLLGNNICEIIFKNYTCKKCRLHIVDL